MTDSVTVIVPVWNRADLLRKLLATISLQSRAPENVIVVDNCSTDDAPEVARLWGARVISLARNAGFAAAANRGIEESRTEWIALVNSDVELDSDWLRNLIEGARAHDAWFAGGKILMAADPSRLDGAFDLVAKSGCAWRAGNGRPDTGEWAHARRINMVPATAALYKRSLFDRIGNFAEVYGSYMEDVDLSLRAAAADLDGVYVPAASCIHQGSASGGMWSSQVVYLMARNQALLVRRLFPIEMARRWRWKILAGQLLWALPVLRHGQIAAWVRGKSEARRLTVTPVISDSAKLESVIAGSELEIEKLQRSYRMDMYWRLYFLFTGGGSQ